MRLIALVRREIPEHLRNLAVMTALSAVSIVALLWLVNTAAQRTAGGQAGGELLLRFILTIVLFAVTHEYVLVTASVDVEGLLHRMRVRLFDEVRRADQLTLERLGRAALQSALAQETQMLARTLPMLVLGGQQATVLVFLAFYLAYLSPLACVIAFAFAAFALTVRFSRMVSLGEAMQGALNADLAVFDGLTDMLRGFKEVRMSRRRAEGVVRDLRAASATSRRVNTETKRRWGWEFALLQALFYALVGLMVFVVPMFTTEYHQVVVPATILTLFIVGPVGTLAYVTPMVSQTEFALANLDALSARLRAAAGAAPDEAARPLAQAPSSIGLREASFAYRDPGGATHFVVGPISVEFRAGEIAFVTGGNGSGKSTLIRLLTGLMPLDAGCLVADGTPVEPEQMQGYRDQIATVFSDYHLSRRLYGLSDADPARVADLLEQLAMSDKVQVRDGAFSTVALSTGQRKRLALMVALLEDKRVVVLDEWAAGQDPHFRRLFYESWLPELKAQGRIVICVTHDDHWFHVADRALHMVDGRLVDGAAAGAAREAR